MEFNRLVRQRRSIRDYSQKQISEEALAKIFDLVKYSPSSYNLQPWEFIVVREAKSKKKLRKCANDQRHVEEAAASVIVLGKLDPTPDAQEIAADRIKKGTMDAAKKEKFDAAVKNLAKHKQKARIWATKSTSLAAMTLMLAAKNIGIDSCAMEGFDPEMVRKEFEIKDDKEVVMIITLGYRSKEPPERPLRFAPKVRFA